MEPVLSEVCQCGAVLTPANEPAGVIYVRAIGANKRWANFPQCTPCFTRENPGRQPIRVVWEPSEPTA